MVATDVLFAVLLVVSVGVGYVVRWVEAGRGRELFSAAVGICMVAVLRGVYGLHSLVIVIGTALIILHLSPRICHIVSFIWCFGYLLFFRTTKFFGLPEVPSYADGTQLFLTLKLVGLAFEVSDSYKEREKILKEDVDEEIRLGYEYRNIKPRFLDILLYSYCYIGILTGPYYTYRTYRDMMKNRRTKRINIRSLMTNRFKWLCLVCALYIVVPIVYPIKYTLSSEFWERSVLYRVWYTLPLFLAFRARVYCAWLLAECMCFTSTLGAYPKSCKNRNGHGPTDMQALQLSEKDKIHQVEYDFNTIKCLDIVEIETHPTFRKSMKAWNMTVQYWMAHHVYKRFPIKALRFPAIFCVSAFWHGIHTGYYMSFLTVAFGFVAERSMEAAFRHGASPRIQQLFNLVWWFIHFRTYDYGYIPFMHLTWDKIYVYWNSIYFWGHFAMISFAVLGQIIVCFRGKRTDKQSKME